MEIQVVYVLIAEIIKFTILSLFSYVQAAFQVGYNFAGIQQTPNCKLQSKLACQELSLHL